MSIYRCRFNPQAVFILLGSINPSGRGTRVGLRSHVTEVGTLLLEAEPLDPLKPDERWRVELSVRGGG